MSSSLNNVGHGIVIVGIVWAVTACVILGVSMEWYNLVLFSMLLALPMLFVLIHWNVIDSKTQDINTDYNRKFVQAKTNYYDARAKRCNQKRRMNKDGQV